MKQQYTHFSQSNRDRIEALLQAGHKPIEIAHVLKRHKSTISKEIAKNRRKKRTRQGTKNGPYEAAIAHHKARVRRSHAKYQGKDIEESPELKEYIIMKLKQYWSPDEISGRMRQDKLSFYASKTAIYEWLHSHWGQYWCKYLASERYSPKRRKKKATKKCLIPHRIGIEQRPLVVDEKLEFGHFEGDTIVSGKKHLSKASLAVVYERKSKYLDATKISSLKPQMFHLAMKTMKAKVQEIKTMTLDNGIENRDHETFGFPVYFCDPYSSWQKPGVENANKMIRRFIKKGTDISHYSEQYVRMIVQIINNKPRKSLGYKTPNEVMKENNLFANNKNPEVALRG